MTTTLRLVIRDGSQIQERRYTTFPVRIGRNPASDCQVFDTEVSRAHAQLDLEEGELVLRDLHSQNGTFLPDGDSIRRLRGGSARFPERRVEFLIGRVRIAAALEEGLAGGPDLPPTLPPAARYAARAVLDACAPVMYPRDIGSSVEALRHVVDACFRGVLAVRVALQVGELVGEAGEPSAERGEAVSALLKWTQATTVALRVLEQGFEVLEAQNGRLATDAVDALLLELAPERLERETSDVCTEWPAARASATWARYRAKHRKLVERHASRPSLLLGKALGQTLEAQRRPAAPAADTPAPISERRPRAGSEASGSTQTDPAADQPPSSR